MNTHWFTLYLLESQRNSPTNENPVVVYVYAFFMVLLLLVLAGWVLGD